MLQEILLSLSGVPSPIWEKLREKRDGNESIQDYVSPPEQAMLEILYHLSQLHSGVKEQATEIAPRHPSLICRAVSSSIVHIHLASFRRKIIEVESSILQQDAAYVGGYQIVPLSTIVADFDPWIRRLEWLKRLVSLIGRGRPKKSETTCTSAAVLGFLENERHTGYSDLEATATELYIVAQSTWMRSISTWILYGQLPSHGAEDFMIQEHGKRNVMGQCILRPDLVPGFVTQVAAKNILAIGNAIRQMRSPNNLSRGTGPQNITTSLLAPHLEQIKLLTYPLNPSLFEAAMLKLNRSISQNALSDLLPLVKIVEICKVIQDYLLLGRGEFAISFITNCDERVATRQKSQSSSRPVRKLGRVDDMTLKDTELNVILSKTWSDLAAVQGENETEDDVFHYARKHLRLNSFADTESEKDVLLLSTFLPIPTVLHIDTPPDSPLRFFLSQSDITQYSRINSFLLSIRRSQLRLSDLWKLTGHRRCHPTPLGPPISATAFGRRACESRRKRENSRSIRMRKLWSSMNKSLFFLNELNSYLHGEVVHNSWRQFEKWLEGGEHEHEHEQKHSLSGGSSHRTHLSKDDPRTLAQAHSIYLNALKSALLLDNAPLVKTTKSFLELLDHLIALFNRLLTIWQGLDLQEDDGVVDAFNNYVQDEKDVMGEMNRARTVLEEMLEELTKNIKDIEKKTQSVDELSLGVASLGITHDSSGGFLPWRARTLDRLVMKLDFLYGGGEEEKNEELVDELRYE